MRVVVKGLTCPVCGCEESNKDVPGTVNIRGFKVCDDFGWWSECLRNHDILKIDGVNVKVDRVWFVEMDNGDILLEIAGQKRLVKWHLGIRHACTYRPRR